MSITLIDEKQIKDYRNPTGLFQVTGLSISGDVAISGLTSGTNAYFRTAEVENLTVSNSIISTYLSGIVGTTVTGSGIIHFLSSPEASGNNTHYRHIIHTGDTTYPIQAFSSYSNQDDWYYFNNGGWSAFPALGLSASVQNESIVRHIWSPTGMDVFSKYFSDLQTIYAGNITGGFNNSLEFQSPTQGFTINHIPFWQEYYDSADSRYVRKKQYGIDYVPSGIKVSGVPIVLPVSGELPTVNHGSGTLLQINDAIYFYTSKGYQLVSPITGLSVTSGGMATGSNPIFSGMGQIVTQIQGNNRIGISGGGVNQFAISGGVLKQGNLIISGRGNHKIDSVSVSSGTVISISGGVESFAITSGLTRQGNLIVSGAGFLQVTEVLSSSGAMLVFSGIGDGTGTMDTTGPGNITGIGVNLSSGTILSTGGFVFTGESRITTYTQDYGNNISGIVISGASGVLETVALVSGIPRYGNIILSGKGGLEITEILTSSGVMFAFSGGGGVGGGGIGNVTGLGVNLDAGTILTTGGIVVTGVGAITTSLVSLGDNISGIRISGTQTVNNYYNTYTISGEVNVTGIGVNLNGATILNTGGFVITGENGISTYMVDKGGDVYAVVVSGTTNSVYTIQHPFALESGLVIDDGLNFSYATFVDRMEGWVQDVASGTGITVDIQKNDVTEDSLTIPELSGRAETTFSPHLSFAANDRFSFKISQCPADPYPGQNLRVRIHYHN